MLSTFHAYLWKEWRDARGVAIGFALAIPVLLLILAFVLPPDMLSDGLFSSVVAVGCFGIALLSLGSDLVPGEARRGRLDFLRRLPSNLLMPFVAKLVFFTASLTFFTLYGWLVACLLGEFPSEFDKSVWTIGTWILCSAPWVFAVSCWLPRGALALPATGLLLALFGLPLYFVLRAWPILLVDDDVSVFQWVLGLGAVAVAALSFVRGYRFGRGIGAASWRGLALTLVLFVPVYAYTGYRVHEWSALDIGDDTFTIRDGYVDVNGRYAYLNTTVLVRGSPGPTHALVVDLRDGSWERRGEPGDMFLSGHAARGKPARVVDLLDRAVSAGSDYHPANKKGDYWVHFLDATTGEKIKSGWSHMPWPEVKAKLGGQWIPPAGWRWVHPCGNGYSLWKDGERAIYDLEREKLYSWPKLPSVLVRRGRWLVREEWNSDWLLYDPDTEESEPAKGLQKRMVFVLLKGGRLLTISRKHPLLAIVDPETGERNELDYDIMDAWSTGTTPDGAPILTIKRRDQCLVLARFDPKTSQLSFVEGMPFTNCFYFRLLAAIDEGTVIGIHGRKIVRAQFGSKELEVLFP